MTATKAGVVRICWHADGLTNLPAKDDRVGFQSRDARLLASHLPATCVEYPAASEWQSGDPGTGIERSEEELYERLIGPPVEDGSPFVVIPITGATGVGKTSTMRWVQARVREERTRDHQPLHEIYIAKGSAQPFVTLVERIGALLLDESDRATLKQKLDRGSGTSQEVRATMVVTSLLMSIGQQDTLGSDFANVANNSSAYKDQLVTLVLPYLSAEERGEALPEPFTEVSLRPNLDPQQYPVIASELARLRQGPARKALADRLNLRIHEAHQETMGFSPGWLAEWFQKVRRQLGSSELFLYFEDLSQASYKAELLNALVAEPPQEAQEGYCMIRALVCQTSGEWKASPNTPVERMCPPWALGERPWTGEEQLQFLARKLNIARWDSRALEAAGETAASPASTPSWVVNHCDGCDVRTTCHAAFGTAQGADGSAVGLFPFNRAAAERLIFRGRSSPRSWVESLRGHLEEILDDASQLPTVTMRSRLLEMYRVGNAAQMLRDLGSQEKDLGTVRANNERFARLEAVILGWDDESTPSWPLTAATSHVAEAFDIDVKNLTLRSTPSSSLSPDAPSQGMEEVRSRKPIFNSLEDSTKPLNLAERAGFLRDVWDEIFAALRGDVMLIGPLDSEKERNSYVGISGATGTMTPRHQLSRDVDTAAQWERLDSASASSGDWQLEQLLGLRTWVDKVAVDVEDRARQSKSSLAMRGLAAIWTSLCGLANVEAELRPGAFAEGAADSFSRTVALLGDFTGDADATWWQDLLAAFTVVRSRVEARYFAFDGSGPNAWFDAGGMKYLLETPAVTPPQVLSEEDSDFLRGLAEFARNADSTERVLREACIELEARVTVLRSLVAKIITETHARVVALLGDTPLSTQETVDVLGQVEILLEEAFVAGLLDQQKKIAITSRASELQVWLSQSNAAALGPAVRDIGQWLEDAPSNLWCIDVFETVTDLAPQVSEKLYTRAGQYGRDPAPLARELRRSVQSVLALIDDIQGRS